MTPGELGRYVAYVRAADRSGSLTAVSEAVSSRAVSIESISTGDFRDGTALITLLFSSSDRLQRVITRTLGRLAAVNEVVLRDAADPRVLAVGVVHTDGSTFAPPSDALVSWSGDTAAGQPMLVHGSLAEVDKVLAAARAANCRLVSSSLLPP